MSTGRLTERHPVASRRFTIQPGVCPMLSISRRQAQYRGTRCLFSTWILKGGGFFAKAGTLYAGFFFHVAMPAATHSRANPTCEKRSALFVKAWLSISRTVSEKPKYVRSDCPTPLSPSPKSMIGRSPSTGRGGYCSSSSNSAAAQIMPSLCTPRMFTGSSLASSSPCHFTVAPVCAKATHMPSRRFVPPQTTDFSPQSVRTLHTRSRSASGCFLMLSTLPTQQRSRRAPCLSTASTSAVCAVMASAIACGFPSGNATKSESQSSESFIRPQHTRVAESIERENRTSMANLLCSATTLPSPPYAQEAQNSSYPHTYRDNLLDGMSAVACDHAHISHRTHCAAHGIRQGRHRKFQLFPRHHGSSSQHRTLVEVHEAVPQLPLRQ